MAGAGGGGRGGQGPRDRLGEIAQGREGLVEVGEGAERQQPLPRLAAVVVGRDDDDAGLGVRAPDVLQELIAVHPRQLQIDEHDVRFVVVDELHARGAGQRDAHLVPARAEELLNRLRELHFVIDRHQRRSRHLSSPLPFSRLDQSKGSRYSKSIPQKGDCYGCLEAVTPSHN